MSLATLNKKYAGITVWLFRHIFMLWIAIDYLFLQFESYFHAVILFS